MTEDEAAEYVRRGRTPAPPPARPQNPLPTWTDAIAAWWTRHTGEAVNVDRLRDELADLQRVILERAPPEPLPPSFGVQAERIAGGLINDVFRVRIRHDSGEERLVLKHARAAVEGVPLDPARLGIEAAMIGLLTTRTIRRRDGTRIEGSGPRLYGLSATVGPAWLRHYDDARHVLLLHDLGRLPDLGAWLYGEEPPHSASVHHDVRRPRLDRARQRGRRVGRYIGALHAGRHGAADAATRFRNPSVQQTRLQVQYRAIEGLLERAGVADAAALGGVAVAFGERLLGPGRCLLHGDLWPRSVLCGPAYTRLIDWEFSHFGQPGQDTGHLAAHLWMLRHRAPTPEVCAVVAAFAEGFAAGYADLAPAGFLAGQCGRDALLHAGCELLVRTLGAFQGGYLYDGLQPASPPVEQAVAQAVAWLRAGAGDAAMSPGALFATPVPRA